MLKTTMLDTKDKASVRRFIEIPFRLYKDHPHWVPPIRSDVETMLNKDKHPFYEHSDADFFVAERDGLPVGRLAVLENRPFNRYHQTKNTQFYLFECEENQEVCNSLFEQGFAWARQRGLTQIIGPKGFGPLDGYGILIDGYEHRQLMNMMNYNFPYYVQLLENLGFEKEVDFASAFIDTEVFIIPERVHRIADRVRARGSLEVKKFKSKRELAQWAPKIGSAYNAAFVNNWEYYPLSEAEIKFVLDNILVVADHRLIKVITHGDDVVGFLFGFPDISAAMQRINGRVFPFGIIDLLLEMRRTNWVAMNGAGILPEFQGRGGNALLYSEMENTLHDYNFRYADLTQVAETAVQMRSDLENLGGKIYKTHRVFQKSL